MLHPMSNPGIVPEHKALTYATHSASPAVADELDGLEEFEFSF